MSSLNEAVIARRSLPQPCAILFTSKTRWWTKFAWRCDPLQDL